MKELLNQYRTEAENELHEILQYWMNNTIDDSMGGFIGRITKENHKHPDAPKGSVLNSRILWTFSAAYNLSGETKYQQIADRAFEYLSEKFIDKEYGGVYWTLNANGSPLDTKKQIYALSFAIYGLSEYYKASSNVKAKHAAVNLYQDIVKNSYDKNHGGYFEAYNREWKEMEDMRLSEKDENERKSMNTHLHVLEGFANLYSVWPDESLRAKLFELIRIFLDHIIDKRSKHLILFFEDDWTSKSGTISYGHDIEAAWLVQEAAEKIADPLLLKEVKDCSVAIANAALEGLDNDGGLWYEYEPATNHLVKEKHSWPQAEAMVGFFNAWQIDGNQKWLNHSLKSWEFVQKFIKDKSCGEWHRGVQADLSPMADQDKVGIWKCPYHNSRACMEIIQRTNSFLEQSL